VNNQRNSNLALMALRLTPFVFFLIAWELFSRISADGMFFFSAPSRVVLVLRQDLVSGALLKHTGITAFEVVCGFILGNLAGVLLGLSLWFNDTLAKIVRPYLFALGALPIFAIAPMTVIWFGVGIFAKVVLVFLSVFFITITQAYKGIENIDRYLLARFMLFGADRKTIFMRLLMPTAAAWIISSLQLTIAAAVFGAFIGEFIASNAGLGHMIIRASGLYDTARVIEGVLAIMVLSTGLNWVVTKLGRSLHLER
jgi:NitT/TauT family transport system permease protein